MMQSPPVDVLQLLSNGALISLVVGAVGYGVVKNKTDAANKRLDRLDVDMVRRLEGLETRSNERFEAMEARLTAGLNDMRREFSDVRVEVGEIRGERRGESNPRKIG